MERGATGSSDLKPAASIARMLDAGAGVTLHPVTVADAAELYTLIDRNRARLGEWLPWVGPGYGLPETLRFLEERALENAARLALTMHVRAGGVLCGAIGIHRIDKRHRNSSLGYWLDAEHAGRGIMTRACRAMITEGFRNYGLHRLEIRCGTGNARSAAIARRLGFIEEGILREAEWVQDRWVDLRVFGMLRRDWHAQ